MKIKNTSFLTFYLNEAFGKLYTYVTGSLCFNRWLVLTVIGCMLMLFSYNNASAQEKSRMVRLAKLVIDSTQLERYKAALKEEIETSVRLEPGVLTLYAVSEKNNPTHIMILEIYADTDAYKAHLQTPHFIKYKTGTKDLVRSLELVEAVPIVPGMKIK
jgi:quinol monooxygenase YgiN